MLVDHLIRTGILFEDGGILSFGPEGEAEYGRKNFLEFLSVFTSPPLFRVISGQKELGSVHESTFYKKQDGPSILVLAGRSWKTNHLDWKRHIAYVEATNEKGRSRWIGEGQFLSFGSAKPFDRFWLPNRHNPIGRNGRQPKSAKFASTFLGHRKTARRCSNEGTAMSSGGPLQVDWRTQWSWTT